VQRPDLAPRRWYRAPHRRGVRSPVPRPGPPRAARQPAVPGRVRARRGGAGRRRDGRARARRPARRGAPDRLRRRHARGVLGGGGLRRPDAARVRADAAAPADAPRPAARRRRPRPRRRRAGGARPGVAPALGLRHHGRVVLAGPRPRPHPRGRPGARVAPLARVPARPDRADPARRVRRRGAGGTGLRHLAAGDAGRAGARAPRRRAAGADRAARGLRRGRSARDGAARPAARGTARRAVPRARSADRPHARARTGLPRDGAPAPRPPRGGGRVHGSPHPGRRGPGHEGVGRARLPRGRPPRGRARGDAARHRQDRDPHRDPQQARPAGPRRVAGHADAHRRGPAHARPDRRAARQGGLHRQGLPRALGRQGLSRRPRGGGDPVRRPHHLRVRRLQRDDDPPALPRGDVPGGRRRRARALFGDPVRPAHRPRGRLGGARRV
ncbi:MAG: diguanylate cyclase (GGDEF domain), partial [uncultured Thermoleophilia bacterium]